MKRRLPIAREGLVFIITPLVLALLLAWPGWWAAALPFMLFGLFALWFFRDPERAPDGGEDDVLSPADGRVIKVHPTPDHPDGGLYIAVFMSVFNVHVNRVPVSGKVDEIEYSPGRFLVASLDKASEDNERNRVRIDAAGRNVVFVQIAGLVARRIVCRIRPGQSVVRGQRMGMIRFGSRLDVHLPAGSTPMVKPGDRVQAGQTVIARL